MEKRRPSYFIYLAAVFICLVGFPIGTAFSWTSPILPRFESNDSSINPIGRPLTISESGLIVSMINIGLLFGPCTSGFIVPKIGKKSTLLMFSIPIFVAHLMCCVATSYNIFLIARFLMGFTSGAAWPFINGYLSEISEPENRGVLNSLCLVVYSAGALFTYLVGPFVSIKMFSIINLIPIALSFLLIYCFVPGSPYDFVMKKSLAAAEKSLRKLRQNSDVKKELLEIEKTIEMNSQNHVKIGDIFKNKASSRALFICGTLMAFNALSGNLVVVGYTQTIFDVAGTSIPSTYSAAMVGSVAFIATLANAQLTDRLGRKPIGIFSSLAACISHVILGTFFHLQSRGLQTDGAVGIIPVITLVIFTFSFYFGLLSLPWVLLGELFTSNMKPVASAICSSINFTLVFILVLMYPYLVQCVGIANTYLFFAGMLALCVIFCFSKVIETRGKSFDEIQSQLCSKT